MIDKKITPIIAAITTPALPPVPNAAPGANRGGVGVEVATVEVVKS